MAGELVDIEGNSLHRQKVCVGCGICALVCPGKALSIHYGGHREYLPRLEASRCSKCGVCHQYCPVAPETLRDLAEHVTSLPNPLAYGLDGRACYVGFDKDLVGRRQSAGGGVVTALLKRQLREGRVDAVLHAQGVENRVGKPHGAVCISRTVNECESRRSTFYGPLCYLESLEEFRGRSLSLAITAVPCVIRGLKKLFTEHPDFQNNRVTLLALACGHNVSGQFIDFLATSMGINPEDEFTSNLRDKCGAFKGAEYHNSFFRKGERIASENRNFSLFTPLWRSFCFTLPACHYCSDFWGAAADISVKDAWGRWDTDPHGKSILAVNSPELLARVIGDEGLVLEPLSIDEAQVCQLETSQYKQVAIRQRFERHWLAEPNRRSGFTYYYLATRFSRWSYRNLGYSITRKLLLPFLRWWPFSRKKDVWMQYDQARRLEKGLARFLPDSRRPLVLFGTGKMSADISAVVSDRVEFFVDNDVKKQGGAFCGKSVCAPRALENSDRSVLVLVASSYHAEIAAQLESYGLKEGKNFLMCHELYQASLGLSQRQSFLARFFRTGKERPSKKILVLGGFGFKNTGDEAQLSANLKELTCQFPDHLIKVLSPDPLYTHLEHGRCAVGEAPRVAFFDYGESPLYDLRTGTQKLRFLFRSVWLYVNALLVRLGLPTMVLPARRAALLHEISTADLVYFSGGGYLTGSTLSRLWDGIFFIAYARVLRTPVVLSGQTIGVWNSGFTRRLAKWGFGKATAIATRDGDESPRALAGIGVRQDRVLVTFDDALFCEKETDSERLREIFQRSGMTSGREGGKYAVLNMHFWGLKTPEEKNALLERMGHIADSLRQKTCLEIYGIPMLPSDEFALRRLSELRPDLNLKILQYSYDFRVVRAVISNSQVCVTMKHHPIIFAMGEGVPSISLALGSYYEHKNRGALALFGLEDLNINLDSRDYLHKFQEKLADVCARREEISEKIQSRYSSLREQRKRFMLRVAEILK